jgi:hypothetical protein
MSQLPLGSAEMSSGREFEDWVLTRCVSVARESAPPARDRREANVFRLAGMILQFDYPREAERLMRASEPYFTAHPDERLDAGEIVKRGWIIGLPRLRDSLSRRLESKPACWLS